MRNASPIVLSILCFLTACGHTQSQTPADAIDQYALETVRKVSPVKNPLSKRVIFMIPMRTIPS